MRLTVLGRRFDTDDELLRHRLEKLEKEPSRDELEEIAPGLWDAAETALKDFESRYGRPCTLLRSLRGKVEACSTTEFMGRVYVKVPVPSYRSWGAEA